MSDMPIMSNLELKTALAKNKPDITQAAVDEIILSYSEYPGFGGLVKEELDKLTIYVLTIPQCLMVSSKFSIKSRWNLVRSLLSLNTSEDILNKVVGGAIDKRIHKIRENKDLISIYRPLANLIAPSYDNEFFAATHYQFTHLFNTMKRTNLTGYELKDRMVEAGYLQKDHRVVIGGMLKELPNYIDYADGTHAIVYNPMYTEENIAILLTTVRDTIEVI